MSYQVLARKWRPKIFDEVLGQDHVTRSLQNTLKNSKVGHAYLFTGTRGVGKTTIARIFARALRCQNLTEAQNPCLQCQSCQDLDSGNAFDLIEIDGASNNSVDNIRDLIDGIQYLPTSGKFKIYIIDEVHMLSTSAFNALLKTLEEPPEHVIFLFATTEPEKLLDTVISRCQRYDLKFLSKKTLEEQVKLICEKEEITLEPPELARKLADLGKGSSRDMLSLLQQVLSFGTDRKITEKDLLIALGVPRNEEVKNLLTGMFTGQKKHVQQTYRRLIEENISLERLVVDVLDHLFLIIESADETTIFQDHNLSMPEMFWIFEGFSRDGQWALSSLHPEKVLEVILLKYTLRRTFFESEVLPTQEEPQQQKVETEVVETVGKEEAPVAEVEPEKNYEKTWEGFLAFMYDQFPASAANLEQGNLVDGLDLTLADLRIRLGFKRSSEVFFDYLMQPEVYVKLKRNIASFFNFATEDVSLDIDLLDEAIEPEFKSKIEQIQEAQQEVIETEKTVLLNHPSIKYAEKIFDAKIDGVNMNEIEE